MRGLNSKQYRQHPHREAILRRLRHARPDLHAKVLAGKLTADAAAVFLPSPAAVQEARGLFHGVANGTLTREEVVELCSVSPRQVAIATALGLGRQVRRARTLRKEIAAEFEKLVS